MLIFNKLLPLFVLPLGWVFALLLYALARKERWPIYAALGLLCVSSMPLTANVLVRYEESEYRPIALETVEASDAVVVLGGFLGPPVAPGMLPNVSEAGERLEAGIVLSQAQKGNWLVFTGGRVPWAQAQEVEGERSKRVALARGIDEARIIVTRPVGNTSDESRAIAELMHDRGWRRIVLVTSAQHMPRAAQQFREAGVEFLPFPVDYRVPANESLNAVDFLPRAEALSATESALRELYGRAFYALFG